MLAIYSEVRAKMSYTQADDKTWTVQIWYKDWQGQRRHTTKRGLRTRAEAQKFEADFIANHATDCTMPFARLAELYLEDTSHRLRLTTLANRTFIIKKFYNPVMGDIAINKITPEVIRRWQISFLQKKYSDTYTRTIDNMLVSILGFGVRYYNLAKNPAKLVPRIGKARNNHKDYWTLDEFNKFIEYLNNKPLNARNQIKRHVDNYSLTVAFKLFFYSGLRLGELLALRPLDIDWQNDSIHVSRTYSQTDNGYTIIELPINDNSNRIISLPHSIIIELHNYISKLPFSDEDCRIFYLLNKSNIRRAIRSTAQLANIKPIRIHDLRHSHASLLINLGYNPRAVADRLGHAKIETTLQIYSHLYNNVGKDIAKKLDDISK